MESKPIDEKCMTEALNFIRSNAQKYSLRTLGVGNDVGIASNVLIGNLAADRYRACEAHANEDARRGATRR